MEVNIDFEGKEQPKDNPNPNPNPDPNNPPADKQDDSTPLNHEPDKTDLNDPNQNHQDNPNPDEKPYLEAGTNIDFEDEHYLVAENGDIVDGEGKVIVQNKDVEKWLKDNNIVEDSETGNLGELNIADLKNELNFIPTINNEEIDYPNTKEGLISYINDLKESVSNEAREGVLNQFYKEHPYIDDVINYYEINGTLEGYGTIQDRSDIVIDKDDENQMISILKAAAKEFNNTAINDTYIQYLKDTGHLYDEAKNQLEALQQHDQEEADRRRWIAEHDAEQREQERQALLNEVNDIVHNRKLFDYVLPEFITKEVNGQKYTYNLNDFFDYMTKPTVELENGSKIPQRDYDYATLDKDTRLKDFVLQAWLLYTGTGYNDLINMVEKQKQVKTLKQKSNEIRSQRTIKVKPKPQKVDMNDILLS